MDFIRTLAFLFVLTATASAQSAIGFLVDCSRGESLQTAVRFSFPNSNLFVKGTCTGPVIITTDGLELIAKGAAAVNGAGKDAITINGARRVVLNGLTITGGNNGVVVANGGQVTLKNDTVTGNALFGISENANASATLTGGTTTANGVAGIDAESTSSVVVAGSYLASGNGVFGIDINNGSSLTLTGANLVVGGNTLGVQLGTNASGFLDGQSTLNASNNFTVGLTMVSGSHMVDFGGTITTSGNGLNGISLNSKAGLDLDAASQVQSNNNGVDGVHLEQLSVMTVFNNPQFSGAAGTTTLTAQGNQGDGVNLLTDSEILVDNFAALQVTGNAGAGLALDDGSSLHFGQTIPVTGVSTTVTGNHPDALLTFGSRLTLVGNDTIGTTTCDATVLMRGPGAVTCPHK